MNLFAYDSWLGRAIRMPLGLVSPDARVPILLGPLRGKRWIVGSSNHGCWLGTYEYGQRQNFERALSEGGIVFDVGANVGYYTLLASTLVGAGGHVYAYEPVPGNLEYLREHLALNHTRNVTVIDAAVGETSGVRAFQTSSSVAGHFSSGGDLQVRCVSLDSEIELGRPLPDLIKMDIEGAEVEALRGAQGLLDQARPMIFLATHGRSVYAECVRMLEALGYRTEVIGSTGQELVDIVATPGR